MLRKSTDTEVKFQWHPTLFVGVGQTARAILCDCVQQIREYWSKAPRFLSTESSSEDEEEAVPPFFGFIAFSNQEQSEAGIPEGLPICDESLVRTITDEVDSGDIAWQYLRPVLQEIASINVNTRYHRYKGFVNEYHHLDLVIVAAFEEVKNVSILIDPPLNVAGQFTINRRFGIFLLNQFENRPRRKYEQQHKAHGRMAQVVDKSMQQNPSPFNSCIFLDESNVSSLKFYRRIDAVKVVASFLFHLTATSLAIPLKQILVTSPSEKSCFSLGLVRRRYDNQEVVRMLAGRLFCDITEILIGKDQTENHSITLEDIIDKIQTKLNTGEDALNQEIVKQHFAEIDEIIRQSINEFGRVPQNNFPFLFAVIGVIRTFLRRNISIWRRHIEDLKKRIRILEEKLKHVPQHTDTTVKVTKYRYWLLGIPLLFVAAYVAGLKPEPLYWVILVILGVFWLVIFWRFFRNVKSKPGDPIPNPEYSALLKKIEETKQEYSKAAEICSQFEHRIHQVETIQARVTLTIEELKSKSKAVKSHKEEESWFVSSILWTGELDKLFRKAISDAEEKLREFFVNVNQSGFFNSIIDENYDLVADLFDFCQEQFQVYSRLRFEEVLDLIDTDGIAPPIQTFLNALYRSSSFLWRLGLNEIKDTYLILGYGDFWSSEFAREAQRIISSVKAFHIPSLTDVTMIQLAQGIPLCKYYQQFQRIACK